MIKLLYCYCPNDKKIDRVIADTAREVYYEGRTVQEPEESDEMFFQRVNDSVGFAYKDFIVKYADLDIFEVLLLTQNTDHFIECCIKENVEGFAIDSDDRNYITTTKINYLYGRNTGLIPFSKTEK